MAFTIRSFDKNSGKASIRQWQFHSWHGGICRTFDPLNRLPSGRPRKNKIISSLLPVKYGATLLEIAKLTWPWNEEIICVVGKAREDVFLGVCMMVAFLWVLRGKTGLRERLKRKKEKNRSSISYDKRYRNIGRLSQRVESPCQDSWFALPFLSSLFCQLLFDSNRIFKPCYYARNKRAVFVSSKNRADKFRQLVPKRRRYSSPAPRAGFRLQIYRVIPDVAYILGHFFSAASFQLWIPRLTLLSLTGGRLSNLSDRGKNMLVSRGFAVFFFFLFFYSRFSIRVFRIFVHST